VKLLVVGGTRFVGRAIVEAALARDHEVTLFNRGTHTDVLAAVPRIIGDRNRDADLTQLRDHRWDAVVDVSAYAPAQVRSLLDVVEGRTGHYVYISTVSVYELPMPPRADETAPLLQVDEDIDSDDPRAYGGRKALCERAARERIGDRLAVLRPTVVIGPGDYTDRFPWWVRHVARGGRLAAPSRLEQPIQLIDAGDLAAFAVRVLERRVVETFNTVGPHQPLTLRGMIDVLAAVCDVRVELDPVSGTRDGEAFPLTLPPGGGSDGAFMVSGAAAYGQGLHLTPLADTARAVLREQQAVNRL
jgi:nucleoside-diphosphate-sugar epimerase